MKYKKELLVTLITYELFVVGFMLLFLKLILPDLGTMQ